MGIDREDEEEEDLEMPAGADMRKSVSVSTKTGKVERPILVPSVDFEARTA